MTMVARVLRSLRLVVSGGEILRSDAEAHPLTAQVHGMDGEVLDRVPILGPYGLAYRPPSGSRVITGAVGADRSQLVILGAGHADDRAPELEEGEVALYGRGGATLRLGRDGNVYITGNVEVQGDVRDVRGSMELIRQLFDAHTHPTPVGPTGVPFLPMAGGSGGAGGEVGGEAGGDSEQRIAGPPAHGDIWTFDAALARAVTLPLGPPGTVLTCRLDGQGLAYLPIPIQADASRLTHGVLDGGTP